jgi:truncated hemoglobin YjbI
MTKTSIIGIAVLAAAVGCGSSDPPGTMNATGTAGTPGAAGRQGSAGTSGGAPTLYEKYGAAIPKVVDDAVAGVTADCQLAPYFAVVGTAGHDSVDRLKSCLRLQFTALFGGPATYPGKNDQGDMCVGMAASHAGLGIPAAAFDRFVMDFGGVLKADGVADEDIATIAMAVAGLKGEIVSPNPVAKTACAAGASQ